MRLPQSQEKKKQSKKNLVPGLQSLGTANCTGSTRQEPKELICCCRDRAPQTSPQPRVPELFTGTVAKCEHSKCRKIWGHRVHGHSHNTAELRNSIKIHILWAKSKLMNHPDYSGGGWRPRQQNMKRWDGKVWAQQPWRLQKPDSNMPRQ